MDPVALEIEIFQISLQIRWYGILISSGIATAIILAYRECARQRIDPEHVFTIAAFAIPVALVSARLYYVAFRWGEYYKYHPQEIIAVWHGGLAIHGGVIGGVLAGYFVVKKYNLNFWKMADIAAPGIIIAQAIGRWGNFVNQEAYGYATDLPWAMYIDGAYRHPTFLYEFLWNVAVFVFLLFKRRRQGTKQGEVFLSYVILYSVGRIFIESFRTDSLMVGEIRAAQLISLLLIALSLGLYFYRRKRAPQYNED